MLSLNARLVVMLAAISCSNAQPERVLGRAGYALAFNAPQSVQWRVFFILVYGCKLSHIHNFKLMNNVLLILCRLGDL